MIPFEDPGGGPNFYEFDEGAHYYLNFDNTGDGVYDIRYRFEFKRHEKKGNRLSAAAAPPVRLIKRACSCARPTTSRARTSRTARSAGRGRWRGTSSSRRATSGEKTMPNYDALATQATKSLPGGGKVFAGQRDDPFFVDLGQTFDSGQPARRRHGQPGRRQATRSRATPRTRSCCRCPRRQVTRDGKSVARGRIAEAASACGRRPSGVGCR